MYIFTSIYTWETNRRKRDLKEDRKATNHSFVHSGVPYKYYNTYAEDLGQLCVDPVLLQIVLSK